MDKCHCDLSGRYEISPLLGHTRKLDLARFQVKTNSRSGLRGANEFARSNTRWEIFWA